MSKASAKEHMRTARRRIEEATQATPGTARAHAGTCLALGALLEALSAVLNDYRSADDLDAAERHRRRKARQLGDQIYSLSRRLDGALAHRR